MSSEEIRELVRKTVKEILEQEPEIILETLTKNPNILQEALAKVAPWTTILKAIHDLEEHMATKKDLERLAAKEELEEIKVAMATKNDLKRLEETMATKKDLRELEERMATREELEDIRSVMATKKDLEKLATKEELEKIRSIMATKDDLKDLATKKELEDIRSVMATKDDLRRLEEAMATKAELEEIKAVMATKKDLEDLKRILQIRLDALGARWGLLNEEAFREGIRSILREAGFKVDKWIYMDEKGEVYGHPSTIDLDILIRNNIAIAVEITSSVRRGDYIYVKRKAELYEKVEGRKPAKIIIVTPYIDDRNPDEIILRAREIGIEIIAPEEAAKKIEE